jgi:hypothetical protein
MFLVGYKLARKQLGINPNEDEINFYENFHNFVEERYKVKTSNSWAKIIMLYAPDEKTGFETFFKLLNHFQSLKPSQSIEKIAMVTSLILSS